MMLITRVRLVNFSLFTERDFSFSGGLNVISLPNGGGKSSLVNAIAFGLYGASALPRKINSYIRDGSDGSPSYVKLEGILGDAPFSTISYLSPRSRKTELRWKNVLLERARDCEQFWSQHVLPFSLFEVTALCRQREAALLAFADPSTRRFLLSSLLRIDVIQRAIDSLKADSPRVVADVEKELERIESRLSELSDVDASKEQYHREQLVLHKLAENENPQLVELKQKIERMLSESRVYLNIVNSVLSCSDTSITRCPVCGSNQFDVAEVKRRQHELQEKVNELTTILSKIPPVRMLTEAQRERLDTNSAEYHEQQLRLIQEKRTLLSTREHYIQLQKKLSDASRVRSAKKLLREFLESLSEPLLKSISHLATNLLVGSPFQTLEITPTFDILVDGKPFSRFSMGQRDFLAVVLRVSLSYAVTQLYTECDSIPMILDSIGDSLDPQYYSQMLVMLESSASRLFSQIILTTHHI